MFSDFGSMPGYRELPKTLRIGLLQSTMIWNSLLVDTADEKGLRSEISAYLKSVKDEIDAYSERNFIYVIATRPRVRVLEKPRYRWLSNNLIVCVAIGNDRRREKIVIPASYFLAHGLGCRPTVTFTSKKITFDDGNMKLPIPIHTLLLDMQVNLGLNSEVTYVGRTENPGTRVIDGNHRGLSDTLTTALESQDDVFLFSSIFHARHHSSTPDGGMVFIVSNSLTDEIAIEPETDLVEKLLIYYFDTITQTNERIADLGALRNIMMKLRDDKHISAVEISFEIDDPSEYFRFGNAKVPYSSRHAFVCKLVDNELNCDVLPTY
jgi:hypothetical protein